jgi:hypothetical protein
MAVVLSSWMSSLRRVCRSRRLTQALVGLGAVIVAVELAASASQSEWFAKIGWRFHGRPQQLARDNDLDPLAYFAPTAALTGARQLIPPRARYAVVVGNDPPVPDPALIRIVFDMWLVPRAYTNVPAEAQWIIAYHHSSESIGVPYESETGVAPDVNVLEVRR